MYSNSLPSYSDLELMRKANISGIAVDGNGISLSQTVGTEIYRFLSEMVIFLGSRL